VACETIEMKNYSTIKPLVDNAHQRQLINAKLFFMLLIMQACFVFVKGLNPFA
jgi:hypothetical protein